jgi:hypothetical protein
METVKLRRILVTGLIFLCTAISVYAHHSFEAEFDSKQPLTLKGSFTKIEWINPHIYFYMDVKDDSGKVTNWTLESFPTGFMHRAGLNRDTFTIGEPITVLAYRAKDATKSFGWMQELTLSSGRKIEFGGGEHPPITEPK